LIGSFYPKNKTFAFTFNLLTDKEGKKYSKSVTGETIWLDNSPEHQKDFFNFFCNMSDEQAKIYTRQFTFLEESQIEELLKLVKDNPPQLRILQRILVQLV
jgi:tyrosyl-tRNA synthetase